MPEDFHVKVNSYGPGRNLVLRWTDPLTGRRQAKSAGTTSRREAERRAAVLQKELTEGKYATASKLPWRDFTWRYCDEVVPGLAEKTGSLVNTVFGTVERILQPKRLADLTSARLSYLASKLRQEGKSEATIQSYLAHLRAAMSWAVDVGLLREVPKFPKTHRAKAQKLMKGRPITAEEFERMLAMVPAVLTGQNEENQGKANPTAADPAAIASWKHYLRGLWWSGLRLGESLTLSWERRAGFSVDTTGKYPMLRIRSDSQKSGREQLYPVAPEFAQMLLAVPETKRRGRVFRLLAASGKEGRDPTWISKVVARIGEAARVKVDERVKKDRETGVPKLVVKYASAHDLRRSFGFRWSRRILPTELRELMRHADVQTTMKYYVGQDAENTAEALWAAYEKAGDGNNVGIGNIRGNTGPHGNKRSSPRNA
jgi:integrase